MAPRAASRACRQAHGYGNRRGVTVTGTPRSTTTRPAIAPPTNPMSDRWNGPWKRDASGRDGFVDEANVTALGECRESRRQHLRAHADIHRRQSRELSLFLRNRGALAGQVGQAARAARRGRARWTRVDEPTTADTMSRAEAAARRASRAHARARRPAVTTRAGSRAAASDPFRPSRSVRRDRSAPGFAAGRERRRDAADRERGLASSRTTESNAASLARISDNFASSAPVSSARARAAMSGVAPDPLRPATSANTSAERRRSPRTESAFAARNSSRR